MDLAEAAYDLVVDVEQSVTVELDFEDDGVVD